jgi:hypothetical protein
VSSQQRAAAQVRRENTAPGPDRRGPERCEPEAGPPIGLPSGSMAEALGLSRRPFPGSLQSGISAHYNLA